MYDGVSVGYCADIAEIFKGKRLPQHCWAFE